MRKFYLFLFLVAVYYLVMFGVWLYGRLSFRPTVEQPNSPDFNDVNLDVVVISFLYLLFYIIGLDD